VEKGGTEVSKGQEKEKIQYHWEIDAYKLSVEAAMEIYELSKLFPEEEKYSLTDQIRNSSRSVSAQIAEGWRRRKYRAAFVNKMNEAEGEAAETQVWLEYSVKCEYMSREDGSRLHRTYDEIIGKLINMLNHPEQWCLS
jgi:four helix bundle protein